MYMPTYIGLFEDKENLVKVLVFEISSF